MHTTAAPETRKLDYESRGDDLVVLATHFHLGGASQRSIEASQQARRGWVYCSEDAPVLCREIAEIFGIELHSRTLGSATRLSDLSMASGTGNGGDEA